MNSIPRYIPIFINEWDPLSEATLGHIIFSQNAPSGLEISGKQPEFYFHNFLRKKVESAWNIREF